MKTKLFFLLLFITTFISCKKVVDVTETEVNAVQKVLNFYNGKCLRSKGFKIKNSINSRNFELEMSESELLEHNSTKLKLHSANIAYLFYSNLKDEKNNYDEIIVKVNLKNGSSEEFIYTSKELQEVENLQIEVLKINELIVNKDYENLALQFESSINIDKENVAELFNSLEKQYGKILKTQFQGFELVETNNYGKVTKIGEALMLKNINPSMNLIFSRENKKLISIEFP